ncbi:MAG: lysine biosynthesis protein LysW [Nitrospirota bacterium]
MKIVICPVCEEELDLDDDLMGGDIIICPVCDTDLKLIDVDGVFAAEAV